MHVGMHVGQAQTQTQTQTQTHTYVGIVAHGHVKPARGIGYVIKKREEVHDVEPVAVVEITEVDAYIGTYLS